LETPPRSLSDPEVDDDDGNVPFREVGFIPVPTPSANPPPDPRLGHAIARRASALSFACLLAAGTGLAGCKGASARGAFVWVDDFAQADPEEASYLIGAGDLLSIRVYNQDAMSGRARVREDGKISLPFVNDVQAAGLAPIALAARLQAQYKEFVVNPVVTVSLEERRSFEVSVVGEVGKPGLYKLDPKAGVLQALASAGGLSDFASRDRIFVLRGGTRIRFTFQALTEAQPKAARFRLRNGDIVVVE
jgi:polysaccharide export outer membrane protein